jgi:hypothetical protein
MIYQPFASDRDTSDFYNTFSSGVFDLKANQGCSKISFHIDV